MSSFINPLYPENHIQTVRQLYLDAALLEQTIQQHVEASKVGYRSSNSTSHPSSPVNDHRRFNLSDTSSTTSHHSQRRQNSVSSTNSRRSGGGGGGRQQQQTPQEEQGFQVPSSDHFRSGHEELAFLRDSLKDVYESVLLEDLVAAVEKSVDDRLWRYVFYAPVEELRAELRKLEKNSIRRQEVMDELSKLLDKGTGFYHEMIMALRSEHNLDLGNIAVEVLHADLGTPNRNKPADSARFSQQQQSQQQQQQQQQQQRSRNGRSRQQSKNKEEASISSSSTPTYSKESLANCIQKCFIYLGDLARYRTNIRLETQTSETASKVTGNGTTQSKPSASDWQAAFRFYQRAIRVFPDSGKPYGQLAILSSYASDDIDALFWYCMSLGAKSPSVVVRDNLKVFFSRYQNRFKDLLVSICPNAEDSKGAMAMSLDDEEDADSSIENEPNLAQQLALARCDLSVLLIKVQMDLFAPHLRSVTFHNSTVLDALCQKLSSRLASRGFEGSAQKMVASMVFIVYDLHARTTLSSFPTESTTKEGSMGLKQAQRAGLIYLLRIATVLLDRQLLVLSYMGGRKKGKSTSLPRLDRELMAPVHCLIEFWMSYWDQIWGMIRLEEKWAGAPNTSGSSDLSLKSAAVTFFRSYVNLLNMDRVQYADEPNVDDVSQRALCLLQQDRGDFYGLMPFRRFHLLLVPCMDTPEDMEETRFNRLLLFAAKIIQASEGIRGTVIEMSFEPVGAASDAVNPSVNRQSQYRVLDADDKRLLREKGSKMLASHWLQDQVTTLQKGLENTERRSVQPGRGGDGVQFLKNNNNNNNGGRRDTTNKIPITMVPSMIKLPPAGQTRLTDHYQRERKERTNSGGGSGRVGGAQSPQSRAGRSNQVYTNSSNSKYQGPPRYTCVVDMSVLVWNLNEIKTLLDHRQCLLIVPLDVIDRLDQAKKGQDKENQKTREAIRFLDDWLNIVRWGRTEPLLVGQNVKDSLGRWSEAVPYLVDEEEEVKDEQVVVVNGKKNGKVEGEREEAMLSDGQENGDTDTVMTESETKTTATTTTTTTTKQQQKDANDTPAKQQQQQQAAPTAAPTVAAVVEEEMEVEVRNVMNVPRVWRPILGACLFMLRKREESKRIPSDQFVLLTEDPDLAYYAGWFDIPVSDIHAWKLHAV